MFSFALEGMKTASAADPFLNSVLKEAVEKLRFLEGAVANLVGHLKFLDHQKDVLYREGIAGEEVEHLLKASKELQWVLLELRDKQRAIEILLKDPTMSDPGEYVMLGLIPSRDIPKLKASLDAFSSSFPGLACRSQSVQVRSL